LDVDRTTLGLSPDSLHQFLEKKARKKNGSTFNIRTGRQITAIVPMHTFGHPVRMKELLELGDYWNIPIVEDAAESIGSYYTGKACGTLGKLGIFSFNGNKTITCGGGGVIVTNEADLAKLAKHITTTAKIPHQWDFVHDMIGYNFRMPNLNAALACSQLKQIDLFLISKRNLAQYYAEFFSHVDWADFITEPVNTRSNYWLNAILLRNREQRDQFLRDSNNSGIMTRPCWKLLIDLEMYKNCEADTLENSRWIIDRLVNIPSSALPCFVQ
jgi:dTDP-4-amino-4,6-dideoxygalactose transaminase